MNNYTIKSVPAGFTEITSALITSKNGTTDDYFQEVDSVQVVKHEFVWDLSGATYTRYVKENALWVATEPARLLTEGCFYNDVDGKASWGYCDIQSVKVDEVYTSTDGVKESSVGMDGCAYELSVIEGNAVLKIEKAGVILHQGIVKTNSYVTKEDGALFIQDESSFEAFYDLV